MLKKYLVKLTLLLPLIVVFSCRNSTSPEGFTISGKIPALSGQKVILKELDPKEIKTMDSLTVGASGNFIFSEKNGDAGFYLLQFEGGKELVLSIETGDNPEISGDLKNIPERLQVSGSEGTRLLKDFYSIANKNKAKVDSLKSLLQAAEGSPDFYSLSLSADSAYQKIAAAQKTIEKDFIDKHRESLASLIVLNYTLGTLPVLTMDEDLDYYQKLTALAVKYPNNKHVIYHQQRITVFLDKRSKPKFH